MIVLEIRKPGNPEPIVFSSDKNSVRVGRHSSNDVMIEDESASRFHAEIERRGNTWHVRDLDSRNGLFVNSMPALEYPLNEGDTITIGETSLTFHSQAAPVQKDDQATRIMYVMPQAPAPLQKRGAPAVPGSAVATPGTNEPSRIETRLDMPGPGELLANLVQSTVAGAPNPASLGLLRLGAQFAQILAAASDIDDMLGRAADTLAESVPFTRLVVLLWDSERTTFTPRIVRQVAGHGNPAAEAALTGEQPVAVSMTIVNYALEKRQALACIDAMTDPRFSNSQSVFNLRLRTVLCAPILGRTQALGVIHIDAPQSHNGLQPAHLSSIMLAASTLASALEREIAREDHRRRERRADQARALAAATHCIHGLTLLTEPQENLLRQTAISSPHLLPTLVDEWTASRRRLADSLSALYDYARGRMRPFEPISLNIALSAMLDEVAPAFEAAGIETVVQLDPQVPAAFFDVSSLRHALMNLVANAVESLERRTEKNLVVATELVDGSRVRVIVQDTGEGIAPDIRRKIFEPFFTTRGGVHMGLGLTYAEAIILAHGGTLEIDSVANFGTTAIVNLPLRREAPASLAPEGHGAAWLLNVR